MNSEISLALQGSSKMRPFYKKCLCTLLDGVHLFCFIYLFQFPELEFKKNHPI